MKITFVQIGADGSIGEAKRKIRLDIEEKGYKVLEQPANKMALEFIGKVKPEVARLTKTVLFINLESELRTIYDAVSDGKRLTMAQAQHCAEFLLAPMLGERMDGLEIFTFAYRHTELKDRLYLLSSELMRSTQAKNLRTASIYL